MERAARLKTDHRGTRAVQSLIERAPATGSLALWMQHRDVDELALGAPIATDGQTVRYAPAFAELVLPAQVGWVAHQILHVAFLHVPRRERLRHLLGDVDDVLYNACADALVNSTLSHLPWLQLPTGAMHVEKLVQRVLHRDMSVDAALLHYDVERLYREIDDRAARGGRSSRRGGTARNDPQSGRGANTRGGTGAESERQTSADAGDGGGQQERGEGAVRADGPRSSTVRAMQAGSQRDLLAGDDMQRPEDGAQQIRDWSERLTRGHASDGQFSILRSLGADVPRSRVPWQQVLRSRLSRALVREPEVSWSRPARSWLANQGRDRSGRRLPFEPGTVSARQVPRLGIVLDVSGSIDQPLLARLGAQLNAIARRTRAHCTVIVGDDQVRHVVTHNPDGSGTVSAVDLTAFEISGGGGTNFVPLLNEAARHQPDYVVVLTDLDGPAGERPMFPVLWAVPAASALLPVPFGTRLIIE